MYKTALNQRLDKLLNQQCVKRQAWLQQSTMLGTRLQAQICSPPLVLACALLATLLIWWPANNSANTGNIKPIPGLTQQAWYRFTRLARSLGIQRIKRSVSALTTA